MEIEFGWDKPISEIVSDKTGGPDGLLVLANKAASLMEPYVPARNQVLAQNKMIYQEGDHAVIHYLSPYAHYQYMGELYVDPITEKGAFTNGEGLFWSRPGVAKKPSGKKLEYSTFRHQLATSRWDEAMMAARKDDLIQSYENYLRRRV